MTSTARETNERARQVAVTDRFLTARLEDGREISVPLEWYPRLQSATPEERNRYEIAADGRALRWPELDEDILLDHLLQGRRSGESERSLRRWLRSRADTGTPTE